MQNASFDSPTAVEPDSEGIGMNHKKAVVMLGAGASAASDFHLPTMDGFFTDDCLAKFPELEAFLKWFYPGRSPNQYNLEDVLSYLDISRTRMRLWGRTLRTPPYAAQPIELSTLLKFVQERLVTPEGNVCQVHRRLFEGLDRRDSILTLNYDLIADRALIASEKKLADGKLPGYSRMGKLPGLLGERRIWADTPPSFFAQETEWGFFIKLHGSVDWLYCPTPGCRNNVNLYSVEVSGFADSQLEGSPCRYCAAALRVFIIPPVAAKRLDDLGRMASLWNLALDEIISATSLTIIGTSFAPTDFELRWLIRQAVELREHTKLDVNIVNRNADHRARLRQLFQGNAARMIEYSSVDDFLSARPAAG